MLNQKITFGPMPFKRLFRPTCFPVDLIWIVVVFTVLSILVSLLILYFFSFQRVNSFCILINMIFCKLITICFVDFVADSFWLFLVFCSFFNFSKFPNRNNFRWKCHLDISSEHRHKLLQTTHEVYERFHRKIHGQKICQKIFWFMFYDGISSSAIPSADGFFSEIRCKFHRKTHVF